MLKKLAWRQFVRKSSSSTVDPGEIQHFKQFSPEWWDELGQMRALHSLNKLRVPFITDGLINALTIPASHRTTPTPLKDLSILDIGCGGGILSEPLARLGGNITGLDANQDLIQQAQSHAKTENLDRIQYLCNSIEKHAEENNENKYDVVVASEILEHVTEKETFLNSCIKCLKPNGSIFITTISKTVFANIAGICLAENVFKLLPKGTHEFEKFIEPHKLQRILEDGKCKTILVHGMGYNPLNNEWFWIKDTSINYALHAIKLAD